jgi:membrane-associated phospholipid phosphatase
MNLHLYIGFLGPMILFFITAYLVRDKYLYLYVFFFIMNSVLNQLLKHIFHQRRPSHSKSIINETTDQYGMPSGHAQSVFFSTSFLYFVKGPFPFVLLELCISMLTLYQRWSYRQHTINQLILGSLVGIMFSWWIMRISPMLFLL